MSFIPGVDLARVEWAPTLRLHFIRAVAAGCVWAVILMIMSGNDPAAPSLGATLLGTPVGVLAAYFIGLPFYIVAAKVFSAFGDMGRAIAGFMTFALALGIVVGDPVVYLLDRKRPNLVPMEDFKVFNFVAILFVQRS